MDIEMELSRLIIQEESEQQIIVLKERHGQRAFPIVIGIAEAYAIDRQLKGIQTPRPLTHDLVINVIQEMGAHIERMVINDLRDQTFYALLYINRNGQIFEVDSRPSDAIILCVAREIPIFVAEHVLDEVC